MSRTLLFGLLLGLTSIGAAGAALLQETGGPSDLDQRTAQEHGLTVGAPLTFENLTIFPVITHRSGSSQRFVTLDQGLKDGTVEVLETKAIGTNNEINFQQSSELPQNGQAAQNDQSANPTTSSTQTATGQSNQSQRSSNNVQSGVQQQQANVAQQEESQIQQALQSINPQGGNRSGGQNRVNQLMVVNKSKHPLYLMPGEIVVGGDQDRIIAQETIVPPTGKPVVVSVFCVEQGRWGSRAVAETQQALETAQANAAAGQSVALSRDAQSDGQSAAQQANRGKFIASIGNVSNPVRKACQVEGDQSKVWKQVGAENGKSGLAPETSTYIANFVDGKNLERLESYIEKLHQPVLETKNVVGVVVAVNGKLVSMDVFQSTELFQSLWPKLLKSFALEAANELDKKEQAVCTRKQASEFLLECCSAEKKSQKDVGLVRVERCESKRVITMTATHETNPTADGTQKRQTVHQTSFVK